eukprot:snap_masked-scaffold_11-processed-gene-9.2-mRNA-1 protein AED:1.00 eAED:1.00 QI:0/-1/0/0/-1/1/1/0/357
MKRKHVETTRGTLAADFKPKRLWNEEERRAYYRRAIKIHREKKKLELEKLKNSVNEKQSDIFRMKNQTALLFNQLEFLNAHIIHESNNWYGFYLNELNKIRQKELKLRRVQTYLMKSVVNFQDRVSGFDATIIFEKLAIEEKCLLTEFNELRVEQSEDFNAFSHRKPMRFLRLCELEQVFSMKLRENRIDFIYLDWLKQKEGEKEFCQLEVTINGMSFKECTAQIFMILANNEKVLTNLGNVTIEADDTNFENDQFVSSKFTKTKREISLFELKAEGEKKFMSMTLTKGNKTSLISVLTFSIIEKRVSFEDGRIINVQEGQHARETTFRLSAQSSTERAQEEAISIFKKLTIDTANM